MAGLKKRLQNITGFDSVNDALYNAVGAKSLGDLAKDTAVLGASTAVGMTPLGVPLQAITGKSVADLAGYDAKTEIGQKAQKGLSFIPSAQRVIGGGLMTATGIPGGAGLVSSGLSSAAKNAQGLYENTQQTEMPMYKHGGAANTVMINVEKDELCVNPHTMEILDDYEDLPPHPKGKDNINQKGNVTVAVGSVVVPANMRKAFMNGNRKDKEEIIVKLLDRQAEDKSARGGLVLYKAGDGEYIDSTTYGQPVEGYAGDEYGTTGTSGGTNNQRTGNASANSPTSNMLSSGGNMGQYLGLLGQAIPQYLLGNKQYKESKAALEALSKIPASKYTPTPELLAQGQDVLAAKERARYGFTPEQRMVNTQDVARAENTQYQRAQDLGGAGLAGSVNAGMGANKISAINQMASEDAKLQQAKTLASEQAQRMYSSSMQGLANQQTAVDQLNRYRQEAAYGKAMQKGLENKYGAYGTAGAVAGSAIGSGLGASSNKEFITSLLGMIG